MNQNYFEGVLQLRNPHGEVVRMIKNQINKNPGVFVAKEIPQPDGMDLYFSSNRFLLTLGRRLKKSFTGELKITRRIYTVDRMTSKNIYRVTVLFRVADKGEGDESKPSEEGRAAEKGRKNRKKGQIRVAEGQ